LSADNEFGSPATTNPETCSNDHACAREFLEAILWRASCALRGMLYG
jgi:hypothetical protein